MLPFARWKVSPPVLPRLALAGALACLPLALPAFNVPATALDLPEKPTSGYILDSADLLTDAEEAHLNRLIEEKNGQTDRARLAVQTLSQDPGDLRQYATDLGNAWGVGDVGQNNGVMLVIDMESRETFLAVSEGAGKYLSDSQAESIARKVLGPHLSDGAYATGIESTVKAVYSPEQEEEASSPLVIWGIAGTLGTVAVIVVGGITRDYRKVKRSAEEEMLRAQEENPGLSIPDDMRRNYIKYRYANRSEPAVGLAKREAELAEKEAETGENYTRYAPNFASWLPLYAMMPHLYSGTNYTPESTGGGSWSSGSSSFGGGGGFSGGGGGGHF